MTLKKLIKNPWVITLIGGLIFFLLGLMFYKGNIQTTKQTMTGSPSGVQAGRDVKIGTLTIETRTNTDNKLNVGEDTVVIGDVSGNIGDRSVVIGATDNRGNVILNQPMAVGRGAYAGSGSIAIGANAGAGAKTAEEK